MRELAVIIDNDTPIVTRDDGLRLRVACGDNDAALSATELLAASLGSCIAASLLALLSRHGANCNRLRVTLQLSGALPDAGFTVVIALPPVDNALQKRCRRAAVACPVRRALNVPVEFHWQDC